MFGNDPLQTQMSLGGYTGAINPFTSPYGGSIQTSPLASMQSQYGSPFGQPGYGGFPNFQAIAQHPQLQQLQQLQQIQQLQALASILGAQTQIPQFGMSHQGTPWQMQQPGFQQNPLIAAALQNPLLTQQLLQQQSPYAQSGFPLAPQSWVGQHQLGGRGIY